MLFYMLLQLLMIPLATVVAGLTIILFSPVDPSRRLFPAMARIWSRILFMTSGVRVRVHGRQGLNAHEPAVFVANHQSLFDPPVLFHAIPSNLRVIAKKSLFLIPIFGQALWAAGVIPIDRRDRKRSINSMNKASRKIRSGLSVLVFAEGTRSRDGRLLPLKKGAFILAIQAGVPVQPVVIQGSRDVHPPGSIFARPGTVHVTFLKPVDTSAMTFDDRGRLLDMVAEEMRIALDKPVPTAGAGRPEDPLTEPTL